MPVLIVRMNADLAMGEVLLKKTGSGNLFTVFGEPDVRIEETPDGIVVEILGVDVCNPTTGEIRSSDTDDIALWMVDTDYDANPSSCAIAISRDGTESRTDSTRTGGSRQP